jgi:hypothetical protein
LPIFTPLALAAARAAFVRWEIISRSGGKDVNREAVGLRHVHGDEFHVAVHQVCDEGNIARQPVEAGDKKDGTTPAAFVQGGAQLGAVVLPPALDLDEFRDDMSTFMDISGNGIALRLHAQAGDALLVG